MIGLTYYNPYLSGLSVYAERLAKTLVSEGHEVTVLTSMHEKGLDKVEVIDGVKVVRVPVVFQISKGLVMPAMPIYALREMKNVDVINLHLPQLDAAIISTIAKIKRIPVVSTYQCDLELPKGFINCLANSASNIANNITARNSDFIVASSRDYADTSPFLGKYIDKVKAITPSMEVSSVSTEQIERVREKYGLDKNEKHIGIVGRLAAEKGVEVLAKAMQIILKKDPNVKVLHIGPSINVLGEEGYAEKLQPLLDALGDRWTFLGKVPFEDLAPLYSILDVLTLPSTNRTEAFGMVQIEAMSCGTPVITSDLPGMRQPIILTGMGKLFPARDAKKLASSIEEVLQSAKDYSGDKEGVKEMFSPQKMTDEYIKLFEQLVAK